MPFYSLLDFDDFRTACLEKDDKHEPWEEMRPIIDMYLTMFPEKRIQPGIQKMILSEVKYRLDKGYQFLRSGKAENNKPMLFLYGKEGQTSTILERTMAKIAILLESKCKIKYSYVDTNTVPGDHEVAYISKDGIQSNAYENYYFESPKQLLTQIEIIEKVKYFTIENWLNIQISRGRKHFSQDYKYNMFYRMSSPITGVPTLFGYTSVELFFSKLKEVDVSVSLVNAEYYYVTIAFTVPNVVKNLDVTSCAGSRTCTLLVNSSFITNFNLRQNIKDSYMDIISLIGADAKGSQWVTSNFAFGLILIGDLPVKVLESQPAYPLALKVLYNKCCQTMRENYNKAIWIAAGKGSGKTQLSKLIIEKGFICIDSDTYGRVLYQMWLYETSGGSNGCPYTYDDAIRFATWIYDFIRREDFDKQLSFHEALANTFITENDIKLENILSDQVPISTYKAYSILLAQQTSRFIKAQNFYNLLGYIPTIATGLKTTNTPMMIVFTHNSLELFPAMSNAIWKMETFFNTFPIILTRQRQTSIEVQSFLGVFYEKMEPLIANALPVSILYKALSSLPPYTRSPS